MKIYKKLAQTFIAMKNCETSQNTEWYDNHRETIVDICKNKMPSGSGFDNGTQFSFELSSSNKLVFECAYHPMDENGYYNSWKYFKVIVVPNLSFNFELSITGRMDQELKTYIADEFYFCLDEEIE